METGDGDKRKTETETETLTATTETEITALNKTIPKLSELDNTLEYETAGVIFYLLSDQFISRNESIISII